MTTVETYQLLATALLDKYPVECGHLFKPPKSSKLRAQWGVLVNNQRVKDRDLELFKEAPLSMMGLGKLLSAGKLSETTRSYIWTYIDMIIETLTEKPVHDTDIAPPPLPVSISSMAESPMAQQLITALPESVTKKLRDIPEEKRLQYQRDPLSAVADLLAMFTKEEIQATTDSTAQLFAGDPRFGALATMFKSST